MKKGESRKFLFSLPLKETEASNGGLTLSREESKQALFSLLADRLPEAKHGVSMSPLVLPSFKVGRAAIAGC